MSESTKRWDDSLISMGLGALVVVVSGILLFNYFNNQAPKFTNLQNRQISQSPSASTVAQANTNTTSTPQVTSSSVASQKATATTAPTQRPTATVAPTQTAIAKATIPSTTQPSATVAPTSSPASQANTENSLPTKHTVVAGESLWKISERYYGSGYEWKKIAQANNFRARTMIDTGEVLEIPRVELISAAATVAQASTTSSPTAIVQSTVSPSPTAVAQAPTKEQPASTIGSQQPSSKTISYTVAKGDTLWSIAQAQCNNGYMWSSIAKQNKLDHPSLIHNGNTLNVTCQ